MRRNRVCLVFGIVLLVAALIFGGVRYHQINTLYPNPHVTEVSVGEPVAYKDITITATGSEMMQMSQLPEMESSENASFWPEDTVVVRVDLTLYSETDNTMELYRFALENGLSATQPLRDMMYALYGSTRQELSAGESATFSLYFPFTQVAYSEKDWMRIADMGFTLELVDTYPQRIRITL